MPSCVKGGTPRVGGGTPVNLTTPPVTTTPPQPLTWSYLDPQGQVQGPFQSEEMLEWYNAGYFPMDLMVRRVCDNKFTSLTELHKIYGRVPFTPGTHPSIYYSLFGTTYFPSATATET